MNSVVKQNGWEARLSLAFEWRHSRTVLAGKQHLGPLVVQKPFYPENEVCHVYIIHPPGGVVGGDILAIDITGHSRSHALITTPAANKFYRSSGPVARLAQNLEVKENACLNGCHRKRFYSTAARYIPPLVLICATIAGLSAGRLPAWVDRQAPRHSTMENFASALNCTNTKSHYLSNAPYCKAGTPYCTRRGG